MTTKIKKSNKTDHFTIPKVLKTKKFMVVPVPLQQLTSSYIENLKKEK